MITKNFNLKNHQPFLEKDILHNFYTRKQSLSRYQYKTCTKKMMSTETLNSYHYNQKFLRQNVVISYFSKKIKLTL